MSAVDRLRPTTAFRDFRSAIRKRFARRHGLHMLAQIEKHRGPLSAAIKRRCDEYSREVFGDQGHAPWLYAYAAMQGEFKEGWIPCSYYNEYVVPDAYTAGDLCHSRHLTRRILGTDRVPDLGYVLGGKLYDTDFRQVGPNNAADLLFRDHDQIVFKRNRSSQGRGIVKVVREDFHDIRLDRLPDGVFQHLVQPHAAFESLLPERGPTIRFTTVLGPEGKAELRAAHLRLATLKSQFVAPGSGVSVSIDLHTGRLLEQGYIPKTLQPIKHHPDTKFVFSGHPIPNFSAAVDHVLRLHNSFPVSKIIGWDLCIDLHGQLQIFEWNLWWPAIRFIEMTTGPCFRGLGWESLRLQSDA